MNHKSETPSQRTPHPGGVLQRFNKPCSTAGCPGWTRRGRYCRTCAERQHDVAMSLIPKLDRDEEDQSQ